MKLFLLLLLASALVSVDAAPPNTVKEIARNLQELLDRSSQTNSDKQRITLTTAISRTKMVAMLTAISSRRYSTARMVPAMKIGADKKRTVKQCSTICDEKLQRRPNSADSGKVCSALCTTHYSYPNPTEYEAKLLDAMDALPRKG